MKKSMILAAMAVAVTMISCDGGAPKANLKSDVDSVSYAIGMAQTQGLRDYLVMQLGVDTAYMGEFVRGLNDGANAGDDKKKNAYYAGLQIGQQISNQMVKGINYQLFGEDSTQTISMKNFMAGFITGATGKKGLMTIPEAQETAQRLMQQIKTRETEKTYGENKRAGEEFLAKNATKEGVVTLPSGVQYRILKEGNGAIPADTSTVTIHYEGRLINDTVFDSSYKRNQPFTARCDRNIKGFTEALTHMPVGSIWEVYIPQELAYGERQSSALIKPFSALIFKIELLDIKK